MFKKITIGGKLAGGFLVVLTVLGVIVFMTFRGLGSLVGAAEEVNYANELDSVLARQEANYWNFMVEVNALLTDENVTELQLESDVNKFGCGLWLASEDSKEALAKCPSLAEPFAEMAAANLQIHSAAKTIKQLYAQTDLNLGVDLERNRSNLLIWFDKVEEVLASDDQVLKGTVELDPAKGALGKWLASNDVQQLRQKSSSFDRFCGDLAVSYNHLFASAAHLQELLASGDRVGASDYFLKEMHDTDLYDRINDLTAWHESRLRGLQQAKRVYSSEVLPSVRKVQGLLNEARSIIWDGSKTQEDLVAVAESSKGQVAILGCIGVVVGIVLAVLIAVSIVVALKRIIHSVSSGASQVSSAAAQVSSASQALAEGATEQAASLEEISSSLEEVASMTQQNADNALAANTLAEEARNAVDDGNECMGRMSIAINDIQDSSQQTAKIIKVIDEIAFQTNLLALNAAVEAARAGEAGRGFAVVAEEVRNLAIRSAEAAKNTAEMIEYAVKNANNGVEIAAEVSTVLAEIVSRMDKTTELSGEIAAASQEQAQGIEQVSTAVAQMNNVTQQNSASAEESASASEEMRGQAEQMIEVVESLIAMVGGKRKGEKSLDEPSDSALEEVDEALEEIFHSNSLSAKHAIPFDEDLAEFND